MRTSADMGTPQTQRRSRRVAIGRSRQSGLPEGVGRSGMGMKGDKAGSIAEERKGVGAAEGGDGKAHHVAQPDYPA